MKPLSKLAEKTFRKLIADPEPHTIDTGGAGFMAVHVENIATVELGSIWSIAHYYKQNGDMMRDPDMTFLVAEKTDDRVYPLTFEQSSMGLYQEAVVWDEGKITGVRLKMQRDMATFASSWMESIKHQQRL